QRLQHASPRHPFALGISVVTTNSDCDSAEEEQGPESASQPSPFQHRLHVVLVQESPCSRNLVARSDVVAWEYNSKCSWPKPEKSRARHNTERHARSLPARVGRDSFPQRLPAVKRLLQMRRLSERHQRQHARKSTGYGDALLGTAQSSQKRRSKMQPDDHQQ